ncbi:hypothetical protein E1265_34955, partial [Streptomyces sp. 8K308]|uniref:polymorphic toxin-type HINT domain-containing protein n=1 Tax=Streptomyces sp. 8K308 TaxID=2530388 RepID=UPI0010D531C6
PGTRGFVGGITDNTGLTHLQAREYDPALGRFISLDPLMDLTDPQQLHGYTYANNNPTTYTDPTGLAPWKKNLGPSKATKPTTGRASSTKNIGFRAKGHAGSRTGYGYRPSYSGGGSTTLTQIGYQTSNDPDDEPSAPGIFGFTNPIGGLDRMFGSMDNYWDRVLDGFVDTFSPEIPGAACVESGLGSAECLSGLTELLPWGRAANRLKDAIKRLRRADTDCNSFVPATRVVMADGTSRPIEEVEIGDEVLATDPETGETSARTVTAEISGSGQKDLVTLTIATEQGTTSTVTATEGHPFWVPKLDAWIDASQLTPGARLRTSTGTNVQISAVQARTVEAAVYNLTVEGSHTYYVLAGGTPVLVHNASSCTSGNNSAAATGRSVHRDFSDLLDSRSQVGYEGEFTLPSGLRPDGGYTDPATGVRVPIELKPDTRAQIRRGRNELREYEQEMGVPTGSGQLWVYRIGASGTISYQRVQ